MNRALSLFAFVVALVFASQASAKGLKIGVVNMQRAVSETKDGKRAEARLKGLKKKLETDINNKMKSYYDEERKLRKQWAILKDAEKRKRAQASMKKMEHLRKQYLLAERQLMQKKTQEMMKISRKLNRIISKIARQQKYDYIFANAAVLWAPSYVDITNEVIRQYNN